MLKYRDSFAALGTHWSMETSAQIPLGVKKEIHDRIEVFDATYSRFRKDSLVTRVSKAAGRYVFAQDAVKLVTFYESLYDLTDGRVTPLIGDSLVRAGYDAGYSFKSQPQQDVLDWSVMQWDKNVLTTKVPFTLDFGAAGKGYLVDIVSEILDAHGFKEYVVDASGDLRHRGTTENRVGLEHPLDPSKIIGVVDVQNKSLCASASNRRSWGEGMHHVFDPKTKAPTKEVVATWVIADEALIADGLATALFFVGPTELGDTYDYQYVRMFSDGAIDYSHNFEGELF